MADHLQPLTDVEHEDLARQGARELAAERSSLRAENAALRRERDELRGEVERLEGRDETDAAFSMLERLYESGLGGTDRDIVGLTIELLADYCSTAAKEGT